MPKRVVLDTNLALLLVVGLTDRTYISRHKRLAAYRVEDFELLGMLIESHGGIVFCPNVLSETSNLLRHIHEPIRSELSGTLERVVRSTAVAEEYVASAQAVTHGIFHRLGLTDAVLFTLTEFDAVLLTADLSLYLEVLSAGREAVNYNHVRDRTF
ncbi:MAG TPA: hypothetical protein VIN06_09160 [Devosia sp.]